MTASKKAPRLSKAATVAVSEELQKLGVLLEETSHQYVRRLQREIDEIAHALPTLKPKELAKASRLLAGLPVKPHKGRRKDLKKIDLLIGELQQLVEG